MIKTRVTLEHIVAGKVYHFLVDNDSPTVYIKEALVKFMDYVNGIEEAARQAFAASNPPVEAPMVAPVVEPIPTPVAEVPVEQPKAPDGSVV